uniref:hypothetical protein n=1 Tax=Pedobacter sp. TaxID=1411316 RepID=UPI0015EEE12F|nr:hypothetical protein [Pedobacter sp.]
MENISYHNPIRLPQLILLSMGFVTLLISLKIDQIVNVYVVIGLMLSSLLTVEGTFLFVLYRAFISKKYRIRNWSKRTAYITVVLCMIGLIWSFMLYTVLSNTVHVLAN